MRQTQGQRQLAFPYRRRVAPEKSCRGEGGRGREGGREHGERKDPTQTDLENWDERGEHQKRITRCMYFLRV